MLALSRARLLSLAIRTAATARIDRCFREDDLQLRHFAVRIIVRLILLVSILLDDQLDRRSHWRLVLGTGVMLRTAVLVLGLLLMLLMMLVLGLVLLVMLLASIFVFALLLFARLVVGGLVGQLLERCGLARNRWHERRGVVRQFVRSSHRRVAV